MVHPQPPRLTANLTASPSERPEIPRQDLSHADETTGAVQEPDLQDILSNEVKPWSTKQRCTPHLKAPTVTKREHEECPLANMQASARSETCATFYAENTVSLLTKVPNLIENK